MLFIYAQLEDGYKLESEYKDVHKDMFIDEHEQPNVVEDRRVFLYKIEEIKLYIVEFDENSTIKLKTYRSNCTVENNHWQTIIIITNNKYRFSVNDKI